jgi:uncharacterized protein
MPPVLIDRFFTELFSSERVAPAITVTWHSGEPLTLPTSYYEDAIIRILTLRDTILGDAVAVRFDIQTNGVLINDEWCDFFKRHEDHFDVGVSCDGPAELHDAYRVNWGKQQTHAKTLRGMELLEANNIKYNLISVVTEKTLAHPEAFYKFFFERRERLSGFHFNVLAHAGSPDPALSYSAADRDAYYRFFRQLLRQTHEANDTGAEFGIRNFSQGLARILSSRNPDAPNHYQEASAPLKTLNLDATGNVTTFYAGLGVDTLPGLYDDNQGLALGNIYENSLETMVNSEKLQRIIRDFDTSRRACEASCQYFPVCTGGFEVTKMQTFGTYDAVETTECMIHVKTLIDALLDDVSDYLQRRAA